MKNNDIQLDFNFCRPLDFQKNLNLDVPIENFADGKFLSKSSLNSKHLKLLIVELYCSWFESEDQFLTVSLSKRGYKVKSRYNLNSISSQLISCIKYLKNEKLIDFFPGFYDTRTKISRLTRIRASSHLKKEFLKLNLNPFNTLNLDKRENIYLLDSNQKSIEYRDNFNTYEIREILKNYNSIIMRTLFDIPSLKNNFLIRGDNAKIVVSQLQALNSKSFNLNWDSGGIFFGSWWHKLDSFTLKKNSSFFSINNLETSYLDMSSIFSIFLSSSLSIRNFKIDYENLIKKVPFIENIEQVNYLIVMGISSKNLKSHFRIFCSEKNKLGIKQKVSLKDFSGFTDSFRINNKQIFSFFYSKIEVNWEKFLSKIFFMLIKKFVNVSFPLFKIKDKFYYLTRFESNLIEFLEEILSKYFILKKNQFKIIKCYDFNNTKKISIFGALSQKKIKYSKRFLENKKKFNSLLKKI